MTTNQNIFQIKLLDNMYKFISKVTEFGYYYPDNIKEFENIRDKFHLFEMSLDRDSEKVIT